jgi:hypothetical protein
MTTASDTDKITKKGKIDKVSDKKRKIDEVYGKKSGSDNRHRKQKPAEFADVGASASEGEEEDDKSTNPNYQVD